MLPVVRGVRATEQHIVTYTVVLVALTCLPPAFGIFGTVYLVAALGLGLAFAWLAMRLRRTGERRDAALLFHYSLLYLALLFVAVAIDAVI